MRNQIHLYSYLLVYGVTVYAWLSYYALADAIPVILSTSLVFILFGVFYRKIKLSSSYCGLFYAWFVGYLLFGFVVKTLFVFSMPDLFKSLRLLGFTSIIVNTPSVQLSVNMLLIGVGAGMFAGLYLFSNSLLKRKKPDSELKRSASRAVIYLIFCSLVLKYIVHHVFKLGVPGLEASFSIPVVGGVVTYYVRLGLFAVINIVLIHSILCNRKSYIMTMLGLLFVYLLIDLSVGVKFSIVYEIFILFIYWVLFKERTAGFRIPIMFLFGLVVFTAIFYKYISTMRFFLISGYGTSASLEYAKIYGASELSFAVEVFNRLTGIENVYPLLLSGVFPSWSSIFDSSFAKLYTESVTGVVGAVNAIGSTQIGLLLKIIGAGNYVGLVMGGGALGLLIMSLSHLGFYFARSKQFLILLSPLTIVFSIYLLFGTGNMFFYFKEYIVFYSASYFAYSMVTENSLRHGRTQRHRKSNRG